jgi:integrase
VIPYTKSRKMKVIPISAFGKWEQALRPKEVTPFIFSRDGRPYWRQRLQRAWRAANKASGLPPIQVKNAFRHSLASQEIQKGTPIEAISKMLGHSSIKATQERYANLSPETVWKYRRTVTELSRDKKDNSK